MTIIKKQKPSILMLILLVMSGLTSCVQQDIFLEYSPISTKGWHQDSVCKFNFEISNNQDLYNIYINTRNTGSYQYQNLWLFLRMYEPNKTVTQDTINFYLADQTGKWLGSGVGSVFEMPVLYLQNYKFKSTGKYQIEITHGMRDVMLEGINDIGFQIQKVEK